MIKIQREVILDNACGAQYDEQELVNAMLWYSDKPIYQKKKVALHGKYPAVSLGKTKIHIHRLLMMYWMDNKKLIGYSVHHLDEDRLNATQDNLILFPSKSHASFHNKGKRLSESHKSKISMRNHERKGKRHSYVKKDITPQMVYEMKISGLSFNKISSDLNLDWGCVKQRYDDFIHDNPVLLESQP